MNNDDRKRLVQGQLDAYNRRDIDSFCRFFHSDILAYRLVPTFEQRVKGMAAFREGYGAMFAASPKLHCELKSRIVLNDTVIDEEWVTGRLNSPDGAHVCAIYAFRDGLIDRVWFAG